mgnify:CR=1 FL=1
MLPPTNSIQLAQRALKDIPVGGKTPLSAGLYLAYEIVRREQLAHPDVIPLMIVGFPLIPSFPPVSTAYLAIHPPLTTEEPIRAWSARTRRVPASRVAERQAICDQRGEIRQIDIAIVVTVCP